MRDKKSDAGLASAHQWLQEVSAELDQNPEVVRELTKDLLDLTRDVAHGPSRPAAPLTAFLVGLASGRELESAAGTEQSVQAVRSNIRQILDLLAASGEH